VKVKKSAFTFLISYLLTAITGFLGVVILFRIKSLIRFSLLLYHSNFWSWRFIELASSFVLGFVLLGLVIYSQHAYEKSYEKNQLPRKFVSITLIEMILLFMCQVFGMTIGIIELNTLSITQVLAMAAVCVALVAFYVMKYKQKSKS
jgi:hypothetical protein